MIHIAAAISWIPVTYFYFVFWDTTRRMGGYMPIAEMFMLVYSPVFAALTAWALLYRISKR